VTAPASGLGLAGEPFIDWGWIADHWDDIWQAFQQHVAYTVVALAIGMLISFPLAVAAYRRRWLYPPITWVTGLLYTIPAIALFGLLIPFTGLTMLTSEIGLVSYTLLILIRNTVAGLRGVPGDVREAASGMGYTPRQMLWRIELPLALPAIWAGVRIATVTTIGLVTVTALIGKGGLGLLIYEGFRDSFTTPAVTGAVLSVVFAVAADAALVYGERLVTPWSRRRARD
jgi:osmoprotectant transport system permease protein